MIGNTLGHYRIIEKVGKGGMGEVYRARDEHLSRDVAIKVLPPDLLHETSSRKHFRSEALALSRLNHPNIEMVFDFNTQDGVDFLVIEFVPGQNLAERLACGPLSEPETVRLGIQLADGLSAAHDQEIVHRDLKPANLALMPDGRLKILDFGLARLVPREISAASTGSSSLVPGGTLPYMAPEQIVGQPVDARCDIYAAGLVLYEMATGRRAFPDRTPWVVRNGSLQERSPSQENAQPQLSAGLEAIILKCTQMDRAKRYQSARELRADLERLHTADRRPRNGNFGILRSPSLIAGVFLFAAVFGIAIWYLIQNKLGRDALPEFQAIQMTSDPAWEGQPEISPDGSRIAYVFRRSGTSEIRVIEVRGQAWHRVTDGTTADNSPAWSRDGKQIFYASGRSGGAGIWKVNLNGGAPSLVLRDARDPAISADGNWIAFTRPGAGGHLRIGVALLSDTSQQTMITRDEEGMWDHNSPAWCPDGKSICYSSRHNLWIVGSRGGGARRLTTEDILDLEPACASDGRHVYLSSYRRGGTLSLWRVDMNGRNPTAVTLGMEQESHPSLSADRTRLALAKGTPEDEFVILDRSTGHESRIPYRRDDYMGAIAPDGSGIIFISVRGEGHANLWLQPLEGGAAAGQPRRLTDEAGALSNPCYSPDGRWIACYRISGESRSIYVVPAQGGHAVQFSTGRSDVQPAWSPDGSRLAFVSNRGGSSQIWIGPIREGRPAGPPWQLTSAAGPCSAPSWSRDGSTIAFIADEAEVWTIPSDGSGRARRLTSGAEAYRIRWDPLSSDLLVSGDWGEQRRTLRRVSLKDGQSAPLTAPIVFGDESAPPLFDLSADGRLLLYCRESMNSDIWLFESTKGVF